MPATAQHTLSIAIAKLRRMVALSSAFQAACGVSDYDASLARVFVEDAVSNPSQVRPYAVVSMGDEYTWSLVSGGAENYLRPSGALFLYLTTDTNPQYYSDIVSAEFDAWDFFAPVIEDVMALSNANDADSDFDESHLAIVGASTIGWGENSKETHGSLGRFYWSITQMNWGDG